MIQSVNLAIFHATGYLRDGGKLFSYEQEQYGRTKG